VSLGIIEKPLDGNHGEIHPKGGDFVSTGIPFIMASDINNSLIDFKNCKFISKKQAETLRKGFAKFGDVLLTHKATIGRTAIVPNINTKYILLTPQVTYYRVKDNSRLINLYLKYYFDSKSFQSVLSAFSGAGSTRAYIGITEQLNLPIILPDLTTQQKIASVLSSLDSKIELNNLINAELEAMAKTLYDYWFVQFDFPNAKGKPYKTSGGKMVWNKKMKRRIPEGWAAGELSDIANITMGQSPPGESYNEDGKGTIFFQGCTDFSNRFPIIRQFTTQPTRFAKEGDILLSVRAPVGTLNIAKEYCCIGRGLAALNSKDNCIAYLFGVMINLKQIFDRRNVDGTTFGSITKDDLYSLKVVKPDKEILKQYHKTINPAFEKQNKIELENQKLSELRDWLLPMLMNGQVKVK
jgi:type I restriction enzyme S subunit